AAQAPEPPAAGFATAFLDDGGNFLGVHVEEVTRENAARYNLSGTPRGVGVKEVVKGSPAERAGLRTGDVIVRFDGEAVSCVRKLTRLITETAPDHAARVTVVRGGSEQEVSATLARREMPTIEGSMFPGFDSEDMKLFGERWKDKSEEWQHKGDELRERLEDLQREHPGGLSLIVGPSRRIGVTTNPLGRQLADYFGVSQGVLVSSVEAGSPAEKAGLKAGDIITEADGAKIEDAGDLASAISRKEEGEVTLTVVRDKKQRTVRVTPERRETKGIELRPGSFRIEGPVASIAPARIFVPRVRVTAPDVYDSLPQFHATPPQVHVSPVRVHVPTTPVRVKMPRVRVFAPGERVL
ncbi:MAG: PDZ domain-containing protein, partial [Rubrivivax sp.]|nr:PDZ domain-containing protein [Pyrinomonadaceae bacterium]